MLNQNEQYACYIKGTKKQILKQVNSIGIDHFVHDSMDGICDRLFMDIDRFHKMKRDKDTVKNRTSFPEIATAATLIENKIVASWESIRLFPIDDKNPTSTIPDFLTNILINDRMVVLEPHSMRNLFNLSRHTLKHIGRDIWRRIEIFNDNKELFFVMISDLHPEHFQTLGYNVNDFCDCYLFRRDGTATFKDRTLTLSYGIDQDQQKKELFRSKYYKMFIRNTDCATQLSSYHVNLTYLMDMVFAKSMGSIHLGLEEFMSNTAQIVNAQIKRATAPINEQIEHIKKEQLNISNSMLI